MRRLIALAVIAIAPAAVRAQGWIVPRPCVPPPPCRVGACLRPLPCPPGPSAILRTSSEVRVEMVDRVLRYEISETFLNRGGMIGEADYLFPMPKGAAFQDLKLSINGELVSGETMNATEARRIYEEIVRRQRDPALVEWMGYGLLRTRIFPIMPGEEKRVVVRFQTVAEREGSALRIDYARARPDRRPEPLRTEIVEGDRKRDRESQRESGNSFTLTYERDARYGEPYSPTHSLRVTTRGDRRVVVASGEAPDVTILLPMRRDESASITVLPHAPGREDAFALITITPPSAPVRSTPRDLTFVVDVSGSMSGRKMEQARAAGRSVLSTLQPNDRFRIIDFSTDVRSFRDRWSPVTRETLDAAERYIDRLRAEGSTNISGALEEALSAEPMPGRMPVILFVTDGEPTVGERNPSAIAAMAARLRGRARVFTFGVGADVNASLVEQLALDGRGTAHFVRPEESVERALSIVASRLTSPVLTDVHVRADGVRLLNMHPSSPIDIFAGQDLILLARYDGSGDARIRVEGRSADGPVSWTTTAHFPERDRDNAFVARLWATQRIGWLAAEKRKNGGSHEIDDEIRELGTRYGIPTEFSSYLVLEPGMVAGNIGRQRRDAQGAALDQAAAAPSAAPSAERAREQRFEAAKSSAAQRSAVTLAAADSASDVAANRTGTRRVGARIFRVSDGAFVDARYTKEMRTVRVKPFSAAYFELMERLGELRSVFALGDRVTVAGRTVAIELSETGAERLSERELDAVERDW